MACVKCVHGQINFIHQSIFQFVYVVDSSSKLYRDIFVFETMYVDFRYYSENRRRIICPIIYRHCHQVYACANDGGIRAPFLSREQKVEGFLASGVGTQRSCIKLAQTHCRICACIVQCHGRSQCLSVADWETYLSKCNAVTDNLIY